MSWITSRRLNELKRAKYLMDKTAAQFLKIEEVCAAERVDEIDLGKALATSDPFKTLRDRNAAVDRAVVDFDSRDLAALVMGFYFTKPASAVEDLSFFESWDDRQKQETLHERAHLFSEALSGLSSHITDVESARARKMAKP